MMKTVTATSGQTEVDEFLATPAVAIINHVPEAPRETIGLRLVRLGEHDWPYVTSEIMKLTPTEAGELAAALLQFGADTAPVREVLKIKDA